MNDTCPNGLSRLTNANPWFPAYHEDYSSDLYDSCNQAYAGVPNNLIGIQVPKTGKAYAGIICYSAGSLYPWREYIEVKLNATLINNKLYCVSWHVSMGDSVSFAIENVDLKFSEDSLTIPGNFADSLVLNVIPDVVNQNSYLTNNIGWTEIHGVYTSLGNENYIAIGNFRDDFNTNYIQMLPPGVGFGDNYYYIDDVSVVEIGPTSAGNDTTICAGETVTIGGLPTFEATYYWAALNGSGNMSIDSSTIAKPHVNPIVSTTYVMEKTQCNLTTYDTVVVNVNCIGLKEQRELAEFSVYPNPASESLRVNYKGDVSVRVTDILGKEVMLGTGSDHEIDVSGISEGIYFVSLVNAEKKIVATKKFVVQH